ncbi:hypothetical protein TruAng_010615 [Truncatella angustata]|nr:hypothetical protein TruAng_010615 [Truncatella angustata]
MSTSRTETQVDRSASVASPDHGDILLKPPVSRRKRRPRSGNGKSAVYPYSTTSEPGQSSQGAPLTRSARRAARSCLQLSRGSETERQPRSQQVQQSRPSRRSRLTRRSSPSALGQSTQFGHDDQPRDLVVDASSDVAMAGTPPLYAWAIDDILEQDNELLPWIEEQLDTLSSFPISEDAVEQLLRMLTIEQIYERMLTMTKWRQYAQQMFTIVYCAQRHLTALELIDALLVQVSVSCDLDPKHASYKAEAHSQMANICFTAMLQSRHDGHRRQVQKKHPFVVYAIQYWPEHLLRASYKTQIDTQFSRMFRGLHDSFSTWVNVWNIDFRGDQLQQDKLVCSLYYAALLGLTNVITDICERINSRSDPTLRLAQILKQRGGSHGTALQAASYGGHMYAVELLRQKAADVNT